MLPFQTDPAPTATSSTQPSESPHSKPHHPPGILHSPLFRDLGLGLSALAIAAGSFRILSSPSANTPPEETQTSLIFQPKLSLEANKASERPILPQAFDSVRVEAPSGITSERTSNELQELKDLAGKRDAVVMQEVQRWNQGAVRAWNSIARDLVKETKLNPPEASRAYALLSVAQHDALLAAQQAQREFARPAPSRVDKEISTLVAPSDSTYPSEHAAVAAASRMVLSYLFANKDDILAREAQSHMQSRLNAGVNYRSDIDEGERIGTAVALRAIEYAAHDNSIPSVKVNAPDGPGIWNSSQNPPTPGLHPEWGQVKPWNLTTGSQFRPAPPPAYESEAFKDNLAEVRKLSDTRTNDQLRIAQFWADGPGTATPPGHWNEIASSLIEKYGLTEYQAAKVYASLNTTLQDAGIACWDAKYTYWTIRPSQMDPAISTPVGLPNFPSYVSGHSTFSGAAAEILSYFFPAEADSLWAQASEASQSRMYGGIHYRFDAEMGVELGKKIGSLVAQRLKNEGTAPITQNQRELQAWFEGLK